jgi:SAM-dependent methyltransferase
MCARCGLFFLSPRLTDREYIEFYARFYRPLVSAYHGRLIDARTVQDEQRAYATELVDFLRAHLTTPPRSVLDVGGSTGVVARIVQDAFGSTATVLDPSPDELAVAASAGLETIGGFAEDLASGERRWELVLLCQTIDHLLDVRSILRRTATRSSTSSTC